MSGGAKIRAARSSDGSFALIYPPRGEPFTLNKNVIKGERLREYWFDPRYGVAYLNKEQDTWGIQNYTPPTSGRGNDWVFVLVNMAADLSCRAQRNDENVENSSDASRWIVQVLSTDASLPLPLYLQQPDKEIRVAD